MDTRVRVDEVANFSNLEGEGGLFEGSLHLATAKWTKVAAVSCTSALTDLLCNSHKIIHRFDLRLHLYEVILSFLLCIPAIASALDRVTGLFL